MHFKEGKAIPLWQGYQGFLIPFESYIFSWPKQLSTFSILKNCLQDVKIPQVQLSYKGFACIVIIMTTQQK